MDRAFVNVSSSIGHEHPYIDACYLDHDTELGRKRGSERMIAIKNSDPNTIFVKVVNALTGEIIALGKWNVYKGTLPEEADLDRMEDRERRPEMGGVGGQ